jgi:hypothetical protein
MEAPLIFGAVDLLDDPYLHPPIGGEHYTILPQHNRYMPQNVLREAMGEPGNLTHSEPP